MAKPTGGPSSKKITSFLLSAILIGATISSTLLMGLTISPQEVWANHPAPTLEAPANNACTTDTTPNFNWADVSGAVSYKLEVDQDNQFTPPIFYSPTNPTSSNHNNAGPFPEGTYFWHVATQGSGTGHELGPFIASHLVLL